MCIPVWLHLNRSSRDQVKNGVAISKEDLQQGDLCFLHQRTVPHPCGPLHRRQQHCPRFHPQDGVKISSLDTSYYMDNYFAARRILWSAAAQERFC
ncbi:MAG: NlpC/P60 family protein [Evtepia gabavorous]